MTKDEEMLALYLRNCIVAERCVEALIFGTSRGLTSVDNMKRDIVNHKLAFAPCFGYFTILLSTDRTSCVQCSIAD